MSESFSIEQFEHHHLDARRSLEVVIYKGPDELDTAEDQGGQDEPQYSPASSIVMESQQKMLKEILADVSTSKEPKVVFQKGLAALNKVDQQRFIIENMLEAIKRGESLAKTADTYTHLGLVKIPKIPSSDATDRNDGKRLTGMMRQLKRVSLCLMRLATNALKAIPQFVAIKPSVGIAAMMPSISFELEGESMTIAELFELLTESA